MKNRLMITGLILILTFGAMGCGAQNTVKPKAVEDDKQKTEQEGNVLDDNSAKEMPATEEEVKDLTFADLSKWGFVFSSGVGGWATEFIIAPDGAFKGDYHDSEMGVVGEGYPDGTVYCCTFSGHFSDLTKIDDYTYEMKISDITYENEVGDTEIVDNVCYIYTDAYGVSDTDSFKIFLPGTPMSELSEDVRMWIGMANESETELTMIVLADERNECGIFSYDRGDPYLDAKGILDDYIVSNEEISEQLAKATTQGEMNMYAAQLDENSDKCLNSIWSVLRYSMDTEQFQKILEEQRAWIADKEAKTNEFNNNRDELGSMGPMDYHLEIADMTMERCEELVAYLNE